LMRKLLETSRPTAAAAVKLSYFGPILHSSGDIAAFCAPDPPLFHPNFGDVPVAVEIAHVGVSPNINLKLIT